MKGVYKLTEVCEILKISPHTLNKWYAYEKKDLENGLVKSNYLPKPLKDKLSGGSPRLWTLDMVNCLSAYKETITVGRNGNHGAYSNPNYKETKKYRLGDKVENN